SSHARIRRSSSSVCWRGSPTGSPPARRCAGPTRSCRGWAPCRSHSGEPRGSRMRVVVDELRCDAHGLCADACPQGFALDDPDAKVRVLDDQPDESLRPSLERAALLCPKAAITLET